jgi:hypothetical protein
LVGLKRLHDITPESDTKVHICTIQGLVRRVLYAADSSEAPSIDQYDLMVIDECHRGYLLDREMSDAELSFRGQEDYISKYRRVLEYFDAVKVGLTATPALHTTDIFGDPIFTYSYRQAVIDGYLIDHEPPVAGLTPCFPILSSNLSPPFLRLANASIPRHGCKYPGGQPLMVAVNPRHLCGSTTPETLPDRALETTHDAAGESDAGLLVTVSPQQAIAISTKTAMPMSLVQVLETFAPAGTRRHAGKALQLW